MDIPQSQPEREQGTHDVKQSLSSEGGSRFRRPSPFGHFSSVLTTRSSASQADAKTQSAKQRNACLQFIEVVMFLIGFLFLMGSHEDNDRVFELEGVMQTEMTKQFGAHSKTFQDVEDLVEIWEWLRYGLLPSIVTHKDAVRRPFVRWDPVLLKNA
jgi:hypothetical protein